MPENKRHMKKWNVNECLQLEREHELLGLSIYEIATKHQRTPVAIMNRLDKEGFISYKELYMLYPEMMPSYETIDTKPKSQINKTIIQNETFQEIISLIDMQKNITYLQSQIDYILSALNTNGIKQKLFTSDC